MKQLLIFSLFCFMIIASHAQSDKKLFNGKNLDGWTVHGTEKWYVESFPS